MPIQAHRYHRPQFFRGRKRRSTFGTDYKGGGNYFFFNFAAFTPALPPGDRQADDGSFTRDICDKYRRYLAILNMRVHTSMRPSQRCRFTPDPFKNPGTNSFFGPQGISVPITNPFNPFTVADAVDSKLLS